jgi:predicted deacylase
VFEATPGPEQIGGRPTPPGRRTRVEIPAARIATGAWFHLTVEAVRGVRPGPVIWLSGAIHGDEPIGVEIIRQVLEHVDPTTFSGTLLAVPIVNVFGFISQSRYLPDRRDLNRSFPGSSKGSLGAQLAELFMTEVVSHCAFGIDFHCGSNDRVNHPNVRGNLDDPETQRLARAFGAPVMVHSKPPRGSLREAASAVGVRTLLFEGGEANRFDAGAVREGVDGVLRCLSALDMWDGEPRAAGHSAWESRRTFWQRAPRSGILRPTVELGDVVSKGQTIGYITDISGDERRPVAARNEGLVFGLRLAPLVHRGDAIAHLAAPLSER